MYAWAGVSINVVKWKREGRCITSPGIQETGRKRDEIVSYTNPWTEFLCENEGRAGTGLRDTVVMHSRTHTQRTANKHSTHQIPRAYVWHIHAASTQNTQHTGQTLTGHTASTQNTENSTQHRGRTPNAGALVGRYRSNSLGNHSCEGLRWYIGGWLPLESSRGNHRLVELRWYYILVGANPKVFGKIFIKNKETLASVFQLGLWRGKN